ncbi:MAG: PEP/pyruvate-binding domain-containing protein [Nanoarchaeota archaeon]
MTLIKTFKQISKTDTLIAGGKGASLGEMTQAKIPVPEGFVILSNTFDRFIEETDLNVEIDAVLDEVDIKEIHTVGNASEKIKGMILSKEMPEDIKTRILEHYKKLNSKFVAVRSSATSEDSASAAWAGQLDSFLNTVEETLLENVKKCWASLFTPRAIFYRFEKKLNKDKISVAVVVQKMVDSEESGIAFSVHPVTQDENQIIIEAGFGLGEAIVSGSITPDSYVVNKQGFSILNININEQKKALYKKTKGGNEWKELGDKGKKQVLTEKKIIELSKLIVKIENHYGFPCDIEWAKEKGKFYIVQSRPITTLKSKLLNERVDYVPFGKLNPSRARSKKVCPPFPAMYTQEYVATSDMQKVFGYRAHATILSWVGDDFMFLTDCFEDVKKIGEEIITKSLSTDDYLNGLISWSEKQKNVLKNFIEKNLSSQNLSLFDNQEVAKQYFKYYQKYRNFHLKNTPSWWLGAQILQRELDMYVQNKIISKMDLGILLQSVDYSFEFDEEEKSLLKLAIKLNDLNNNSSENFEKLLDKHVKEYSSIPFGYVEGIIWDKIFFIDKMKKIISEGDPKKILNKKLKDLELKKKKQQVLFERLNLPVRLKSLITISHKLAYLQDLKKTFQTRSHPHLQLVVLPEIAKRLNLDVKYVHFLTPYEIRDCLISGGISKELRVELVTRENNSILVVKDNQYIWILGDAAVDFAKKYELVCSTVSTNKFKGISASSGKVIGVVKVCVNSKDIAKLKKGDILVAPMTTPDYVSAMKLAGAIITDEGGITCHAAIIAREFGIPCIIGTTNATKVLKDGDLVEVDAINGVVTKIE